LIVSFLEKKEEDNINMMLIYEFNANLRICE